MNKRKEQRLLLFAVMDACNELHVDAPDGAWQAAMEDCVDHFNKTHGTTFDPYDMWMAWCKKRRVK